MTGAATPVTAAINRSDHTALGMLARRVSRLADLVQLQVHSARLCAQHVDDAAVVTQVLDKLLRAASVLDGSP